MLPFGDNETVFLVPMRMKTWLGTVDVDINRENDVRDACRCIVPSKLVCAGSCQDGKVGLGPVTRQRC